MFFTQEDYKKIYEWISRNSIKDTEFNEIDSLNTLISQDIKALRDIELILKEIKICPLCGKPMEEQWKNNIQ